MIIVVSYCWPRWESRMHCKGVQSSLKPGGNYHDETKTIFGDRLTPRIINAQDKELQLRYRILNQMTLLGIPVYDRTYLTE